MISKNKLAVNEFSPELWHHLETEIDAAVNEHQGSLRPTPLIAAFDADGTLWDDDAGETFFKWQITKCGLKNLPADPWAHYHKMKELDPIPAYLWLAQISAGHSIEQMRAWAQECFNERPDWPVFQSQKKLIELLRTKGFEIYIVTASIKWAVEPVAAHVGVDFDHVLGITTEIKNGVIANEAVLPITWRQGKAEGLLKATSGVRPVLASGNTLGDIALLQTATRVRLAVSTQDKPGGLFNEEQRLAVEAEKQGWRRHLFR